MPVTALVTLSDVKTHLNIPTGDTSQDAELQGFIDAATAFVQFQTGPVISQQFTEVHSGGGPTIVLDNPPVLSVDTVTEYVAQTPYPLTVVALGDANVGQYSVSLDDPRAGIIARRMSGGLVGGFAGGYRNVSVTYTAGRDTVPGDIRMAVLEDLRGLFTATQYPRSSEFGSGLSGDGDAWSNSSPTNPVGTFPRLAALLAGPSRAPSLA